MGQKTHPYLFRVGMVNNWKSNWFSEKEYVDLVNEDWQIRDLLRKELTRGAVSRIDIERTRQRQKQKRSLSVTPLPAKRQP